MKPKITVPKKKETKKQEIKWMTYTYEPKGKLAKQVKEHLQLEADKKKKQHNDLREVAIYLSGVLKGQGNLSPLGTTHLDSLWEVVLSLR